MTAELRITISSPEDVAKYATAVKALWRPKVHVDFGGVALRLAEADVPSAPKPGADAVWRLRFREADE